jgi:hypothetical protein
MEPSISFFLMGTFGKIVKLKGFKEELDGFNNLH